MTKIFATLITFIFVGFVSVWIAGGQLSSPVFAKVGLPPSEHSSENVVFEDVQGWYFPATEHRACILLMHGIRSNRNEMVGRAIFLKDEGYSSFVIDLQAHGETPGQEITYGYKESNSARSSLKFLRTNKNCEKIIAIGRSLGGAASLLGHAPIEVDGYILEAVYPSIETAVSNRLKIRFGAAGEMLSPLFYHQIPLRLGVGLEELQPLNAIRNIKSPVLIMNGTEDQRTTIEEAQLLFNNAPHPKVFIKVEGASHANLYNYNPMQYKEAILSFLSKYIDGRTTNKTPTPKKKSAKQIH